MQATARKLIWSPEAEADLLAVWTWGASHFSPDLADTHLRDIQRAATHLTDFPDAGVARDQLSPGVRSIVVYPNVVFYTVLDDAIAILRVIDGKRNLAAFFPIEPDNQDFDDA